MDYKITLLRPWRYRGKRGYQVLEPGSYIVPEQLSDQVAALAVSQGMAQKIAIVLPQSALELVGSIDFPPSPSPMAPTPRRRGRRKKLRAPEDKMLPGAPENK